MTEKGKHIYCFIKCDKERGFSLNGVNGVDQVYTISYADLAAVVGDLAPQSAKSHRLVIGKVFEHFTVLPVRFGCPAKNTDQLEAILEARSDDFHTFLGELDDKMELGLKARWKRNLLWDSFVSKTSKIGQLRQRLIGAEPWGGRRHVGWTEARVRLDEVAMRSVYEIRQTMATTIVTALDAVAVDRQAKAATRLKTILDAAFLVEKGHKSEFDKVVNELAEGYGEEIEFICTDPLPPYTFANLVIR